MMVKVENLKFFFFFIIHTSFIHIKKSKNILTFLIKKIVKISCKTTDFSRIYFQDLKKHTYKFFFKTVFVFIIKRKIQS